MGISVSQMREDRLGRMEVDLTVAHHVSQVMKHRHVRNLGYTLHVIPYWEWQVNDVLARAARARPVS